MYLYDINVPRPAWDLVQEYYYILVLESHSDIPYACILGMRAIGTVQLQAQMQNPHAAFVPFCQAALLQESEETVGTVHKSSLVHQIA